MKAGLFDRAEEAYRALEGTPFDTEARLALLALYERSRDWRAAADDRRASSRSSGTGSFAIAHRAPLVRAGARGRRARRRRPRPKRAAQRTRRRAAWRRGRGAGRPAPGRAGRHAEALAAWTELLQRARRGVPAGGERLRRQRDGRRPDGRGAGTLQALHAQQPASTCCARSPLLEGDASARARRAAPSSSRASRRCPLPPRCCAHRADDDTGCAPCARRSRAPRAPLQRYRCAACGFEAQRYFWQCPGCLSWDTFPPQRLEDQ